MFFAATASPALRRHAYTPASRSLERFLDDAFAATRHKAYSFEQDDKTYTLSFDLPGIAKEQLNITSKVRSSRSRPSPKPSANTHVPTSWPTRSMPTPPAPSWKTAC